MEAGPASPETSDAGYSGAASGYANGSSAAGAVLATLFFPFISVIAALLLQGGQPDPRKKAQLRLWAWASVGWLAFGVVMTVVLSSVGSHVIKTG